MCTRSGSPHNVLHSTGNIKNYSISQLSDNIQYIVYCFHSLPTRLLMRAIHIYTSLLAYLPMGGASWKLHLASLSHLWNAVSVKSTYMIHVHTIYQHTHTHTHTPKHIHTHQNTHTPKYTHTHTHQNTHTHTIHQHTICTTHMYTSYSQVGRAPTSHQGCQGQIVITYTHNYVRVCW